MLQKKNIGQSMDDKIEKLSFECQRDVVDEGLNTQYVNNEEHKLQTEENSEIVNLRKSFVPLQSPKFTSQ